MSLLFDGNLMQFDWFRGCASDCVRLVFFHLFVDTLVFRAEFCFRTSMFCCYSSEHEGSRRMKTELLVQMDGLARSDDLVFLLAASNLPW